MSPICISTDGKEFVSLKMKFTALFVGLVFSATYVQAWVVGFWTQPKYSGKYEEFHSAFAENGCYDIVDTITTPGVSSFRYCTDWIHHCAITLHSQHGCIGNILASTDAGGTLAQSQTTTAKGVKSFRMQGCRTVGIPGIGLSLPDIINIDACPK